MHSAPTTQSPWLDFERQSWPSLKKDFQCEVAVVGAGISGVATLYFLLTTTEKYVALFDKSTVASGATGYNAGLAVSYIERPVSELVNEFGWELTKQAFSEMDDAWETLLTIQETIGGQVNLVPFSAATFGFDSIQAFNHFVEQEQIQAALGRANWRYWAQDDETIKEQILEPIKSYVEFVSPQQIIDTLKTVDRKYIAAAVRSTPIKGARINSAKLCYQILSYLQKHFAERFVVYEHTEIMQVELYPTESILHHPHGSIHAKDLILCTNGYTGINIIEGESLKPHGKLASGIIPKEGFMAASTDGALENYAAAFINTREMYADVPYWYLSHAPLCNEGKSRFMLIGGPEYDLPQSCPPELREQYAKAGMEVIKQFLSHTFDKEISRFDYFWSGVMGYTHNGLRWVGPDTHYPHLWYNLGCNGIGIVPAIGGAKRLAKQLQGADLGSSLFDPPKIRDARDLSP